MIIVFDADTGKVIQEHKENPLLRGMIPMGDTSYHRSGRIEKWLTVDYSPDLKRVWMKRISDFIPPIPVNL